MLSADYPQGQATKERINGNMNGGSGSEAASLVGTAFRAKRLRILMVGAGVSGIQFAHDVTTTMENYALEIYEKNPEVGGTWYENRYPGCACDVPAHTYQFAWEPNPRWSKFYAPAPEILEYLKSVVDKHNLRKYIHFNHRATSAQWKEETSTWLVELEQIDETGRKTTITRECDVFVQGVGTLNNWRYPSIKGLSSYKGILLHTANWDDSADLTGKTVAVIGNGASAVQCVPALQPIVGKLLNFVRTPTWMIPHLFSDGVVQKDYSSEMRKRFEENPEYYHQYCRELEICMARGFEALWSGSAAQRNLQKTALEHMTKMIRNPKVLKTLIPDFEIGCRRFTPGDHYLQALSEDNTTMISDRIVHVTETAIIDETGTAHNVDAIICATGFDTSFAPRFPIIGKDGYSLAENWGVDKPTESYMGAMVAKFPNFFVFNPPICPVIGSAFPGLASTSHYILQVISRLQHDCLKSLAVKENAQREFNEWVQSRMSEMAFTGTCKSWYKNSAGKVYIPWPGTIIHYAKTIELVRWEDFDFDWEQSNKFASLGNGIPTEGFMAEPPHWLMGRSAGPSI